MILTKIVTLTSKNINGEEVGELIYNCIEDLSTTPEMVKEICDGLITSDDDVVVDKNEITYFLGSFDHTQVIIDAVKKVAEYLNDDFKIISITKGTEDVLQLSGYLDADIQRRLETFEEFKKYVIKNISTDVILDKMLEGYELTDIDKSILQK